MFYRLNDKNQDQGRQIQATHLFGRNKLPDGCQERFSHIVHESDNRIVGIRTDP